MIPTGVEHSGSSLPGRLTRELTGKQRMSLASNGFKNSETTMGSIIRGSSHRS